MCYQLIKRTRNTSSSSVHVFIWSPHWIPAIALFSIDPSTSVINTPGLIIQGGNGWAVIEIISVVRSLHGSWERARLILCPCSPARISCSIVTRVIGRIYICSLLFHTRLAERIATYAHTRSSRLFYGSMFRFPLRLFSFSLWIKRLLLLLLLLLFVFRVSTNAKR